MRIPTIFTAVDRFSGVVNTMAKSTRGFSSGLSRMNNKLNEQMGLISSGAKYGAIAATSALFYKAGNDVVEYEKTIASLGAVTGTVVGSMNKDIESLGLETKRSVIDIAKSFENIGSKMSEYLKNPTALREIAKQSILMADASRMGIEDSTDNLTSILNQFKLNYTDAARVVNKLSAGEDIGASTISESSDVVRQFAASARMAGASLEETIALVQTTTKTLGKDGVGRSFRNIMVDLNTGKGMDKNKLKALSMVHADINKIINPATKFIDKLQEIKKLLSNKQAMGMFFKKTGFEVGATFLNSFKMFEDYLSFIENNNTAQSKATKNNATFAKSWLDLKSAFTNYMVSGDAANGTLDKTKSLIHFLTENMGSLLTVVKGLIYSFIIFKTMVLLSAIRTGVLSIALGLASFNAGAMSISMGGNAIAIGTYNLATLIATGSTAALGISMWAVVLPILAVVAAIGLLVYAFWDTGEASENASVKQIEALMEQNKAYVGSTNVLSTELQKQEALLNKHNAKVASPNKSILNNIPKSEAQIKMERILLNEKERAAVDAYNKNIQRIAAEKLRAKNELNNLKDNKYNTGSYTMNQSNFMQEQLNKDKNLMFLQSKGMSFDEIEKIYPNLTTVAERKQQLEVIIKDPGNIVKETKFEGTTYGPGIPVMVGSTKTPKKG